MSVRRPVERMARMRAIVIAEPGGPEVLQVQEVADPRVFAFDEIAEAHRVKEAGEAAGKLVVAGA
jgi:NADPH:quinone reductase-like Zn-dependent oxidoreductase